MSTNTYTIREIQQVDNLQIAATVRAILIEFGVPKVGTAYEDKALDSMFETYKNPKSCYFVIVYNKIILGGAGIMQLQNSEENICELQKMYFSPDARGKGLGSKMMQVCLEKAREFGFEKCYLETMPYMEGARKLYKKTGFTTLNEPLGDTGHYNCSKWMLKEL
ncbi:MAG: GNAT family N-acetyltransferase [Lutibacter sp.]|nr:MAG: GNAT family N-acetyltransferase [Lutibacter sp.]